MRVEEYMNSLEEQIQNKYARELVHQEIKAHIEDQAEDYVQEGMSSEQAWEQAVRQMGDPVETGAKLNRIHRPHFPVVLFGIAVMLTLAGVIMQAICFRQAPPAWDGLLSRTLCCNLIGMMIISALLFFNYTSLVRWTYVLYAGYFALSLFCDWCGPILWDYNSTWMINYYLWTLYPIVFALLLYHQKGKEISGMLKVLGLSLLIVLVRGLWSGFFFTSGLIECVLVCGVVMLLAIGKGILGKRKKRLYGTLAGLVGVAGVIQVIGGGYILAEYQIRRLLTKFSSILPWSHLPESHSGGETDYIIARIQDSWENFSLWGNRTLIELGNSSDGWYTYVLLNIFSWFGIVAGIAVVGMLFFFGIRTLRTSLRQKNRIGFLLGTVCSISMLLRSVAYLMVNIGNGLYVTTSIPFLVYGFTSAVVNSIFVGILLGVCRNEAILAEPESSRPGVRIQPVTKDARRDM